MRALLAFLAAALITSPLAAQTITQPAAGGSGSTNAWPAYVSGNWYAPPFMRVAVGYALTANRIEATPFYLFQTMTVKALGANITTAGTTNVQLAIYANSGGLPNGAALCATGSIADNVAGPVSGICGPATLQPGMYWMEVNANDSTVAFTIPDPTQGLMISLAGNSALGSAVNGQAGGNTGMYYQSQTFGTWPTESLAGWSYANGYNTYAAIWMQAQ